MWLHVCSNKCVSSDTDNDKIIIANFSSLFLNLCKAPPKQPPGAWLWLEVQSVAHCRSFVLVANGVELDHLDHQSPLEAC